MRFVNGNILCGDFVLKRGGFTVDNGRFTSIDTGCMDGDIDLGGKTVIPGLCDIHIHGAGGADFSDGSADGLVTMGRTLARRGVTSFSAASMTLPESELSRAYAIANEYAAHTPDGCAALRGITMEGPFFSYAKRGAQNGEYLMPPDIDMVRRLDRISGGLIRIVCIAPELDGAVDFIAEAAKEWRVSIAHTASDYNTALSAIRAGASHITHVYNAMPPMLHRSPGVIGAASESGVTAELICDGVHVHESAVRAAFKLFPDSICIISDGLSCTDMPDGKYMLTGRRVEVSGGAARLEDGTLAGSATDIMKGVKNAVSFGIPLGTAVRAASLVPAMAIRADGDTGSIEMGKRADFVVLTRELEPETVYIGGKRVQ